MNINDLVNNISAFFTYFIPGYLSLYIKRSYLHEKNEKEINMLFLSLIVSFIIKSFCDIFVISFKDNIKFVIYIISSIILGVLMVKYKDSYTQKKVNDFLGESVSSESKVWNSAMKSKKGAWVRAYLYENNLLYIGMLINYTIDPEDEEKEILLTNFISYNLKEKSVIENNERNCNATVLIKCNNMVNIEIIKGE